MLVVLLGLSCFLLSEEGSHWVPHITAPNGHYTTQITLHNQNSGSESVVLDWYDRAGQLIEQTSHQVAGETVLVVDDFPVGASHVRLSQGVVGLQASYQSHQLEAAANLPALIPAHDWVLDLPDTDQFYTGLAIVQVGDNDADIRLTVFDETDSQITVFYPGALIEMAPFEKRLWIVDRSKVEGAKRLRLASNQPILVYALSGPLQTETRPLFAVDIQASDVVTHVSGPSDLNVEARSALRDFREVLQRFDTLVPATFLDSYASDRPYLNYVEHDPHGSAGMEQILEHFPLNDPAWQQLEESGFVILKEPRFPNMYTLYREIFMRHLPVYVSADSIMDTLHVSFDRILIELERRVFVLQLQNMLQTVLWQGSDLRALSGPQSDWLVDDVVWWLYTAQSLLSGSTTQVPPSQLSRVTLFLQAVESGSLQEFDYFGSNYKLDFSQYKARGHYTRSPDLIRYFQCMTFIQRLPFYVDESPRHAAVAWAISNLTADGLTSLDQWLSLFFGDPDSMDAAQMNMLAGSLNIQKADWFVDETNYLAFRLDLEKRDLGRQQILSHILDHNPNSTDFTPLPKLFSVLGQRYAVDSHVLSNVVWDRVPALDDGTKRTMPDPLDAWFALGNRFTLNSLSQDVVLYEYQKNLAAMDWIIAGISDSFWDANWYHGWLNALRTLNRDTTSSGYPDTMRTQAWEQKTMNSQCGSWAQLRHDSLLYVKQSYSSYGCEYPDAWVDPYPDFYRQLQTLVDLAHDRLGPAVFNIKLPEQGGLPAFDGSRVKRFLESFSTSMEQLALIAESMQNAEPLSEEALAFFNGMLTLEGCVSDDYRGWLTNMLYGFQLAEAENFEPTLADVHTDPGDEWTQPQYLHVGAGQPRLMIITIDQGCGSRAYVGPVFGYHQLTLPERQTDEWFADHLEAQTENEDWTPDWLKQIVK